MMSLSHREATERRRLYVKSKEYLLQNLQLPLTFGDITVLNLGYLMVDDTKPAAFHTSTRLWPIGYKANYVDPLTSILYECEILDGVDLAPILKPVPAFVIQMHTARPHRAIKESAEAAWNEVMQKQMAEGTELEKDAASKWDVHELDKRFGCDLPEVRKFLQGLCGAFYCSEYQFLPLENNDETPASKRCPKKRGAGAKESTPKSQASKKHKSDKSQGTPNNTVGSEASNRLDNGASGIIDVLPPDNTVYRDQGPHVGTRARRFVFTGATPADVVDGVISGWLPVDDQGDDVFISEETGKPADLWRLTYDDDAFGSEDLEESEVKQAIELLSKPLSAKLQKKHDKRLEALAAKAAKLAEKKSNALAQSSAKGQTTSGMQDSPAAAPRPLPVDERNKFISSGKYAGMEARLVPLPPASDNGFPDANVMADVLAIYSFVFELAVLLGGERMSYEELQSCLIGTSDVEQQRFCKLAFWFTRVAARARYVGDEEDVDTENMRHLNLSSELVHDVKLSPGPLLCSKMKDSETVTYTVWHLVNEASWPEVARMLIVSALDGRTHESVQTVLQTKEPSEYTMHEKVALLTILCDEACTSDTVRKLFNERLQEVDRLYERKRVEDAALKKGKDMMKSKQRPDAAGEAAKAVPSGDAPAESGEAVAAVDGGGGVDAGVGGKGKAIEALELMKLLYEQDPQPFEVKYQGKSFKGILDASGLIPKIRSDGKVFDTPQAWICHVQKRQKLVGTAVKAVVFYKGKNLKECEAGLVQKSDDMLLDTDEDICPNVDMEQRKREFEAALRSAERGLRVESLGQDRMLRRYWYFDGVPDTVWVSFLPTGGSGDFSLASKGDIRKEEVWSCYRVEDGTLRDLHEYLLQGPRGPREAHLLQQIQKLEIKMEKDEDKCAAESIGDGESNGQDVGRGGEEGYCWKLLPKIGDIVWARKGREEGSGWFPVKIIDTPIEDVQTEDEEEPEPDDDQEWVKEGSDYIGKRVQIRIEGDKLEKGRVIGWLPADVSDFKSELTGENAALWRVRLDDPSYGAQDLEEFEVKDGVRDWARAEAAKKMQEWEVLSSKSIFGQQVKKVYGQLMRDKETIETFALEDILPFHKYREQRVTELRLAGKHKVLAQVERAEEYLEGREKREEDIKDTLRALGLARLAGQTLSEELEAAVEGCLPYPRVLAAAMGNLKALPLLCTLDELRRQLLAIFDQFKVGYLGDEAGVKRLEAVRVQLEGTASMGDVREALVALNEAVCEVADNTTTNEQPAGLTEWLTSGHEWLGMRLRRPIQCRSGRAHTYVNAKIVGWLPAESSDYVDENNCPAALWHVVWDDGDEEDLEEFEVREGFRALIEAGDKPDLSGKSGVWASSRDRDIWLRLVASAGSLGGLALAGYLIGDRAGQALYDLTVKARLEAEDWDEHCYISGDGGNLVCCDGCPRTALMSCFGQDKPPKGEWLCTYCQRDRDRSARPRNTSRGSALAAGGDVDGAAGGKSGDGPHKRGGSKSGPPRPSTEAQLQKLRRDAGKYGLINGSVCEVEAAAQGERLFVIVDDGRVSKSGLVRCVRFLSEWRGKERMTVTRRKTSLAVANLLHVGAMIELLEGDERRGFTPLHPVP